MSYQTLKLLPQYITSSPMGGFSLQVLKNQNKMTPIAFAENFSEIQRQYFKVNKGDLFCSEADILASQLCEQRNYDFAGIIMSNLCKSFQYFPDKLEHFAIKGYKIAQSNGDYIHMMARLNDLRKIYYRRPDKLYQYVNVLYKQEKCLKELTNHYETATKSFRSIIRKPAPKEDYEQMLAHVQTEIGKLTKKKHPHDAKRKLLSARNFFSRTGNAKNVEYIDMLIKEIDTALASLKQ